MEQRPGADVAAHHLEAAVAGLAHDRPLRRPSCSGRGGQTGAQRVAA